MQHASATARYGVAILATALCLLLRWPLWDVLGNSFPYVTICPAVVVGAYYGGLGPGLLATLLGGLGTLYLVIPPVGSLYVATLADAVGLGWYFFVGLLVSILSESLHRTRRRSEESEAQQRITLAGIGDAVLATDAEGKVTFCNFMAQALTGWKQEEAAGKPLEEVFRVFNESTGKPVENPVATVLRSGGVVGLGNHTLLQARDGSTRPIDDSAAPVRNDRGEIVGVVLIFRDVTEKRQAEREREEHLARERTAREEARFLAEASDVLSSSLDYESTLTSVAELAISRVADGSMVHVIDEAGSFRRLVTAHVNPEKQKLAEELFRRYPPDLNAPTGLAHVLRTGTSELVSSIPSGVLERGVREPEHLRLLQGLSLKSYMIVPLIARGRTLGALTFATTESDRCYGPADLALAQDLAKRAALAVDNARLYREAHSALRRREEALELHRHMEEQLTLLTEASSRLTTSPEVPAVSSAILDLAHRMIEADAYAIWRHRREEDCWEVFSAAGLSDRYLESAGRIFGTNQQMPDRPVHEEDAQAAAFLESRRAAYREEGIVSLLALPLRIGDAVSGTLVFYYRTRHHVDETTIRVATALASLAASAITVAELYTKETALRVQAEGARERLELLAEAGSALASSLDYQATLERVSRLAISQLADWCLMDLVEDDGSIRVAAVAHENPEKVRLARELSSRFPLAPDAPRGTPAVIRSGKSAFFPDVTEQVLRLVSQNAEHFEALRTLNLKSGMIVPLTARGRVLGAMLLGTAESKRRYGPEDLALAEELGRRAAVAIDNAMLYRQLLDADRRKDEFLATLGHELRNPLSPLVSALHVMRSQREGDPLFDEMADMMSRQVRVMVRLVDDLLDVSRITRGKIELRKQRVQLAELIKRAVETVRPLMEERRHELRLSLPEHPLILLADPTRLEQVLANLLNNAAKYTPPGGLIELTAERRNAEAVVRVKDNGIGIRAELLPQIFDLFQQADRVAGIVQEGLGLGLTLVRRLVEMHGGRVTARSDGPDRGSEFILSMPLVSAETLDEGANAASPQVAASHRRGLRVLVVDDNADAANSCALLLRLQGGHEVQVAHDGPSALAASAQPQHDVVLLDIGLPGGMDGYEVCRRLRRLPHMSETIIAALTGFGQEEDRRRALEAGFTAHLTKPVDWPELAELLARANKNGPG